MREIHPSWKNVRMPLLLTCMRCGEEMPTNGLFSEEAQFFSNVHLDCTEER